MPAEIRVVCISREVGAGGETVGRAVAEGLGFRYVDEEIVTFAADKVGVPADLVADVEARRSLRGGALGPGRRVDALRCHPSSYRQARKR